MTSFQGLTLLLEAAKPGLLSRSGYAFMDDSQTPVWSQQTQWIAPRPQQNGQDWYLFTYNRDYRKVLSEYAQLCGPVPMIPRYVLGPWITDSISEIFPGSPASDQPEFKRYNQQYLEEEVTRLRTSHIPFDVLVLDFACTITGGTAAMTGARSYRSPISSRAGCTARASSSASTIIQGMSTPRKASFRSLTATHRRC